MPVSAPSGARTRRAASLRRFPLAAKVLAGKPVLTLLMSETRMARYLRRTTRRCSGVGCTRRAVLVFVSRECYSCDCSCRLAYQNRYESRSNLAPCCPEHGRCTFHRAPYCTRHAIYNNILHVRGHRSRDPALRRAAAARLAEVSRWCAQVADAWYESERRESRNHDDD